MNLINKILIDYIKTKTFLSEAKNSDLFKPRRMENRYTRDDAIAELDDININLATMRSDIKMYDKANYNTSKMKEEYKQLEKHKRALMSTWNIKKDEIVYKKR